MKNIKVRYAVQTNDTLDPTYRHQSCTFDMSKTALLLVDVMGPLLPVMRDHLHPALEAARSAGLPVIYAANAAPRIGLDRYEFTRQRFRSNGDDFTVLAANPDVDPLEYYHGDGPWSRYSDEMRPRDGDYLVKKVPYSGFHETRLDPLLRHLGIDTLFLAGFSAHMCLRGTVIDGTYRNYRVILLRDCTEGGDLLPRERETKGFSSYMVHWMETYACVSTTSDVFRDILNQ